VALTKLDGTAKGRCRAGGGARTGRAGAVVGVGEAPEDLLPFDPGVFAGALLEALT